MLTRLEKIVFADTNGWQCIPYAEGDIITISASNLANASIAKTYLVNNYNRYYWNKT